VAKKGYRYKYRQGGGWKGLQKEVGEGLEYCLSSQGNSDTLSREGKRGSVQVRGGKKWDAVDNGDVVQKTFGITE